MAQKKPNFAGRVVAWQRQHGRHDLPWQQDITPYRVWVSEIMLQQTQVATVIPYYQRFMADFPSVQSLAAADIDDVLAHWSGLGYYARGRNLHKAARQIVQQHAGKFPDTLNTLIELPGIGRSTGAAIMALAYEQPEAILDGNVKRVMARYFAVTGWPGNSKVAEQLWQHSESCLPADNLRSYTQGLMDLGATVCTRSKPDCSSCPLEDGCQANKQGETEHYPGKRPKKAVPQRHSFMLIIENSEGAILLEKRPPAGIWGGLWVLPEISKTPDAATRCELLGQDIPELEALQALNPINHAFTHFRLEMTPVLHQTHSAAAVISDTANQRFFLPAEAEKLGLPKPIREILRNLKSHRAS